jgi:hypothetical protein
MTVLEFDLDQSVRSGVAARSMFRSARTVALLVGVLAVAAVAGGLVRSLSSTSLPVRTAPVAARLTALDVTLTPDPRVLMRLEVSSPAAGVELDRIDLSGGGLDGRSLRLDRTLQAGEPGGVDLEAPLTCRAFDDPDLTATVRARETGTSRWRQVPVTVAGALHGHAGGCALARGRLPSGWPAPARGATALIDHGVLLVELGDLGAGRRVLAASADGTLLSDAPGDRPAGELALLPPVVDCRAQAGQQTLPAGIRLLVNGGPEGLIGRYAPIGPILSAWLRSAYVAHCGQG